MLHFAQQIRFCRKHHTADEKNLTLKTDRQGSLPVVCCCGEVLFLESLQIICSLSYLKTILWQSDNMMKCLELWLSPTYIQLSFECDCVKKDYVAL